MELELIMGLLEEAPETGFTAGEISRRLELNESLVRRRIKTLIKERKVGIVSYLPTRYAPYDYPYNQQRGDDFLDLINSVFK